jgi:hypothetical protein
LGAIAWFNVFTTTNWTLNVRGNSVNSLNSIMEVGEALTIGVIVSNSGTAYRQVGVSIDSVVVAPVWLGAPAPAAGTPNNRDVYTITIMKYGDAAWACFATFAGGN